MTDLITRLSKLDAPDREVDAQIYILFNIPAERAGRIDYSNGMVGWWPKDGPYVSAITVPAYTASVDAAIALAERVLPGCDIETSDVHADFRGAKEPRHIADLSSDLVWEKYDGYPEPVYRIRGTGQSNIRAIALLIALLRAKEVSSNAE